MMQEPEQGRSDVRIYSRWCRRPRTARISPGRFDLDDVSPRVHEQVTAVGACDPDGEVDHPQFRPDPVSSDLTSSAVLWTRLPSASMLRVMSAPIYRSPLMTKVVYEGT